MTTTTGFSPPPVPVPVPAPRPRGLTARLAAASTPRAIGLLMVVLVIASLAWGAVGAWATSQHASAAADVLNTNEPLSHEAQQMYEKLSDADVTATTVFLSGPSASLALRQQYQGDVAQAGAYVSELKQGASGSLPAASLSAVSAGLPVYTGDVSAAQNDFALGYPLTGGSFMQVASDQTHQVLLPAAQNIYGQANTALTARSAQATGWPWIAFVLVISAGLGYVLWRTQRWLSRRTKRTFNYGLLAATLGLVVVAVWLLAAFIAARGDLQRAEAQGSSPAQDLAKATITAQQARGDEILNVISRSGATSFQKDFKAADKTAGGLLSTASAASSGSAAAGITAAQRDLNAWYTVSDPIFSFDATGQYAHEIFLATETGAGSSAALFRQLEHDLDAAITADQAVFSSGAKAASGAFTGLAVAFGVAAVLMVIGCTWGLSQRLAEYR